MINNTGRGYKGRCPIPHYLQNPLKRLPFEKKPPSPYHLLSTPAPLSPCSRILLNKPGTDVCRGRAERPRCSGCQPHAFHSEMKAHSLPSSEANSPPQKKERERGGKKQTLQNAFKSRTYTSKPFCLLEYFSEMMPLLEPRPYKLPVLRVCVCVCVAQSAAKSHLRSPL